MTQTFSAWQVTRYGTPDFLHPVQHSLPQPVASEVLIRIKASAVTRADGMMRAGKPKFSRLFLGLKRPRNDLAGTGLSGEVMAAGPDVKRFVVGDQVFGEAGLQFGANASHICLDENGVLLHKPDAISHEDAAVLCDGPLTSHHFLHRVAELRPGQSVLILGGSGSLGSAAVQIAAATGAQVTATCGARNAGMVASLGADRVIDYTQQDFRDEATCYDVIYDTLGISSFHSAKHSLTSTGRYICPVLSLTLLCAMLRTSLTGSRKAKFSAAGLQSPDLLRHSLEHVLTMMAEGTLAPVIDRVYPLDALVEAHAYMETGHKRGNIVLQGLI